MVADDISGTNIKALNSGTINNLNSVTVSSNGIYVAIGDSGTILRSVDGINWQAVANTDNTSSNLNGVTVNQNGKFVAVGNNGSILSSNDGDNWNVTDQVNSGINLYGVAANKSGTYYVAVGNNTSGDSVILYFETNRSTVWNTATGDFNNGSTLYGVTATPQEDSSQLVIKIMSIIQPTTVDLSGLLTQVSTLRDLLRLHYMVYPLIQMERLP